MFTMSRFTLALPFGPCLIDILYRIPILEEKLFSLWNTQWVMLTEPNETIVIIVICFFFLFLGRLKSLRKIEWNIFEEFRFEIFCWKIRKIVVYFSRRHPKAKLNSYLIAPGYKAEMHTLRKSLNKQAKFITQKHIYQCKNGGDKVLADSH